MAATTLSLAGKTAIVTGSGRENGIGAAIALALARNGARVVINYVSDSSAARAAKVGANVEAVGGKSIIVQADVSTPEGAAKLVKDTLSGFKTDKIDILSLSPILYLTGHPFTNVFVTKSQQCWRRDRPGQAADRPDTRGGTEGVCSEHL